MCYFLPFNRSNFNDFIFFQFILIQENNPVSKLPTHWMFKIFIFYLFFFTFFIIATHFISGIHFWFLLTFYFILLNCTISEKCHQILFWCRPPPPPPPPVSVPEFGCMWKKGKFYNFEKNPGTNKLESLNLSVSFINSTTFTPGYWYVFTVY